jgi:hypothetical protein
MSMTMILVAADDGILDDGDDGSSGIVSYDDSNATATVVDPSPSAKGLCRSRSSSTFVFSVLDYQWLAIFWCCRFRRHPPPHVESNLNEVNDNHDDNENNDNEEDNEAKDVDDGILDGDDGNDIVRFHYTGGGHEVPLNVTHVTVDSSVRRLDALRIMRGTFSHCSRLATVELPEGLETIGDSCFTGCASLTHINIPSTVKVIGDNAFWLCASLESVELPEGLEELGGGAFFHCTSLQSINIPPKIKAIGYGTFLGCDELQDVDLSEGLESIGEQAFLQCPMLRQIIIPSTVKKISPHTFFNGVMVARTNLERVQFCDDVEEFVSGGSIRDWWDNGTSERSLKTYNFLIRCKVPVRLEQLIIGQWQANIHDMIRGIPSIGVRALGDYLNTIDSQLVVYETLPDDVIPLLELSFWKSKILDHQTCRIECQCHACVIISHVLSFL